MPRSQIWDGADWVDMTGGGSGGGDGVEEAPVDGTPYERQDASWVPAGSGGGAYLPLAGGTLTGPLILAANPSTDLEAATKHYVDNSGGGGGIPEAPEDGTLYGRQDAVWTAVPSNYLPLAGGTITGPLTLPADPTQALEAATKQYVDNSGGGGGVPEAPEDGTLYGRQDAAWEAVPTGYLLLTGGTITGDQALGSKLVRNITVSDTAPPSPNVGEVWLDTSGA